MSHQLVVIRHAKAGAHVAPDFERPLTDRGRADAGDAGRWLASQGVRPDAALVSAAVRTCQTWDEVAAAAGWRLAPVPDPALYGADEYDVIEQVTAVPESVGTLVVVGHNPTMYSLVALLADADTDPAAADQLEVGYPTSAVSVFDIAVPWVRLGARTGRLTSLYVGRGVTPVGQA